MSLIRSIPIYEWIADMCEKIRERPVFRLKSIKGVKLVNVKNIVDLTLKCGWAVTCFAKPS